MKTEHNIYFTASQQMSCLKDGSVQLIITSPPYPMIEMWDAIFANQSPSIKEAFDNNNTILAFELMHKELDIVWKECYRVLENGGFLCINVGDATRTFKGDFKLYNNHSKIVDSCISIGFTNLPNIIWRKQTNAPNKFMGSGMLPCGAYVTLEHEYILVFRKGSKRLYKTDESKAGRRKSSFFWEERNLWFSDVWDLKGVKQTLDKASSRERSAAFPLEIPYRIINMYSQQGDTVIDPFVGTGTTTLAAMLLGRNSVGFEIDESFNSLIDNKILNTTISSLNDMITSRFNKHIAFIKDRSILHSEPNHTNSYLDCLVMTSQEEDLELHYLTRIIKNECKEHLSYSVEYEESSSMNLPPASPNRLF